MDGGNEEARECSLVLLLLHKYLYITCELFSGTVMAMKVADASVRFYRSCSVSIFGRKEMKLPIFFVFLFHESGKQSGKHLL